MAYRVRAVTLSAVWTITGDVSATADRFGQDGVFVLLAGQADATIAASMAGLGANIFVRFFGRIEDEDNPFPPGGTNYEVSLSVTGAEPVELLGSATGTLSLGGSISASVPCYLCYRYEGMGGMGDTGVVDAPSRRKMVWYLIGAGTATITASCAGATATGSVDVRGQIISPSASHGVSIIGSGGAPEKSAPADEEGLLTLYRATGSATAALSLVTNISGGTCPTATASDSDTAVWIDDEASNILTWSTAASASAGPGGVSAGASDGSANAGCSWSAARSWSLAGAIYAVDGAYPDPLTISCSRYAGDPSPSFPASGGAFGRSYTQSAYSVSASATASATPASQAYNAAEFQTVQASISDGLTAAGDEPLATRLLMRGFRVPGALSLSQSALGYNLDPMAEGLVTGTGGALAALTDGIDGPVRLRIGTGDTPGGATRPYSPARSCAGWRYLDVALRSVGHANVPATLSFGGHAGSWDLTTGADGATVVRRVDLCAPDSGPASALNDGWDARWPVPTATSATSGPWRVSLAIFGGIPAGRTVEVDYLRLVRVNPATVDYMPTLYPSVASGSPVDEVSPEFPVPLGPSRQIAGDEFGGVTSQDYIRRFLLGNADGRAAIEESDLYYTRTDATPTSYDFYRPTVQEFAGEINSGWDVPPFLRGFAAAGGGYGVTTDTEPRYPGWSATHPTLPAAHVPDWPGQPPPHAPYAINAGALLAAEMHGGGMLYNGASGGWVLGWDRPLGSMTAQTLFDSVDLCGMEGDEFGFGGASPAPNILYLACGAVLRSAAHGLAFDEDRAPSPGAALELFQGTSVVSSGASRAPDGYYATNALPFGRPPQGDGRVRPAGADAPTVNLGALYTRRRHRAVLAALAAPRCDLLASDPTYFPFPAQFSDPDALPSAVAPRPEAPGILQDTTMGRSGQRRPGNGKGAGDGSSR